jgi:hypothetical protein
LALSVSYREQDFNAILPSGFNADVDELIFSDHYDENAASTVEAAVTEVKMTFPGDKDTKMPRDGNHFLCRWLWLTKEKRLLDLATALALDGPHTERSISLLRVLLKKSLGNKLPQRYRDPAGPPEFPLGALAPDLIKLAKAGTMLGSPSGGASANSHHNAGSGSAKKSGARKLVKRARDDDDNDDGSDASSSSEANGDDNGDNGADGAAADKQRNSRSKKASSKPPAKKSNAKRLPTLEEASLLLLTRGELAILSTTKSYSDVQGGLVLLKHKDSNGTPQTTLLEIDKVPEVDAPYRPYAIQYVGVDGAAKTMEDCVAGVELLLDDAGSSRRSLVNVRDRALEPHDYNMWVARVHAASRYPSTPADIKATIARIEALRKAHTKATVKMAEPLV